MLTAAESGLFSSAATDNGAMAKKKQWSLGTVPRIPAYGVGVGEGGGAGICSFVNRGSISSRVAT